MASIDNYFEQNLQEQQNKKDKFRRKEKKEKQIIEMGAESYEHTIQANEEREQRKKDAAERVRNKNFTREDLKKTKFCKHSDCRYGENCVYAHSVEELRIHNCEFGDDCDFITITNGKVFNSQKKKVCRFKHQSETMDECKQRLGIELPSQKLPQPSLDIPPPKEETLDIPPPPPNEEQTLDVPPPPKISLEAKPNAWSAYKDKTPIVRVIQVPKELASQALEMAYKACNDSIRFEIY